MGTVFSLTIQNGSDHSELSDMSLCQNNTYRQFERLYFLWSNSAEKDFTIQFFKTEVLVKHWRQYNRSNLPTTLRDIYLQQRRLLIFIIAYSP